MLEDFSGVWPLRGWAFTSWGWEDFEGGGPYLVREFLSVPVVTDHKRNELLPLMLTLPMLVPALLTFVANLEPRFEQSFQYEMTGDRW